MAPLAKNPKGNELSIGMPNATGLKESQIKALGDQILQQKERISQLRARLAREKDLQKRTEMEKSIEANNKSITDLSNKISEHKEELRNMRTSAPVQEDDILRPRNTKFPVNRGALSGQEDGPDKSALRYEEPSLGATTTDNFVPKSDRKSANTSVDKPVDGSATEAQISKNPRDLTLNDRRRKAAVRGQDRSSAAKQEQVRQNALNVLQRKTSIGQKQPLTGLSAANQGKGLRNNTGPGL